MIARSAWTNYILLQPPRQQYYVINLTNFQSGIDTITSYASLVFAVWIFKRVLIKRNWRYTTYVSCIFTSLLYVLWIPVFYNTFGLRNPWFTIFIDLDQVGKTRY